MASAFFRHPRLTVLTVLAIIAIGAVAFSGLARQEDPSMTERWANVNTFLAGASAERMESLISEPLETALREIPEIRKLESKSRTGYSIVSVEMYDEVTAERTDTVWAEVRDKLSEVHGQMPVGTTEPELTINKPLASTLVVSLTWADGSVGELTLLSRLADALSVRLANVPGTEETEVFGEAEETLRVALDPYRTTNAGVSVADVARAIQAADTKLSAGRLRGAEADVLVEVDAELSSVSRVERIPVVQGQGGQTLRVSDLGTVQKTAVDPPRTMALHGEQRAVFVSAKMQTDLQIESWTQSARRVLERFEQDLPRGIALEVLYEQNRHTGERLSSLGNNLAMALMIVMLLLVWFMGVRSAITVGVALPLSGGMVLGFLYFFDTPLHQMSVSGLILSLGLLIDNAIVVVEDYKLRRRRGADIAAAIDRSVGHLFVPLGASTATTVLAFAPIALAPGGVGDFTGSIGLSVILSVTSSFFLAMTVVPAVAGFLERRWPSSDGTRWYHNGYSNARLLARYRASLQWVLARPYAGILIGCVLPLIGFLLAPTLTKQFFPAVDRDQFQVQVALPVQSSIWQTQEAVLTADRVLRSLDGVVDTHWSVGEGAPRTYYNAVALNDGVQSFAGGWVDTESAEATLRLVGDAQIALSEALPQAEVLALPFEQGPPVDAPISLRVIGADLNQLRAAGEQLRGLLAQIDTVTFTRATLSVAEPKYVFEPDENRAAAAGLRTGDLSRLLNASLLGAHAGTVQEGSTEIDVTVRLDNEFRDQANDLGALPVIGAGGTMVPLEQLGRWVLKPGASAIERYQGERVVTVQAFLHPYTLPDTALSEFQRLLDESDFQLGSGLRMEIGGEAEESGESVNNLMSIFLLCALAMLVVVTLSLNSFRQTALIGLVGALSFGLALFGVRLFGYPLGYMAFIGGLGMIGLAINGAIIVLSALKSSPAAMSNDLDQTVEVVIDATRHIVSTTATTVGGFLPLILDGGTFWPPLATAIAGGVLGSAIIALYLVPSVFVLMTRSARMSGEPVPSPG